MFPDDLPERVVQYWEAVERWYASGTHKEPTREELVKKFMPQISTRTLDRIRNAHPALIGCWPPRRGARPPWLLASAAPSDNLVGLDDPADLQEFNVVPGPIHRLRRIRTAGFDDEGNPVTIEQHYDSETGRLVESFIVHSRGLAALVAGIFIFGMLDWLSDGNFDGVIRMLRLLGCQPAI
jgi:hypothetical protein